MSNGAVDPELLWKRLETVERQNHALKVVGATILGLTVAILVLVVALLVMVWLERTRLRDSTVDAGRFRLRDSKGTVRAELAFASSGAPQLSFFDGDGRRRTAVGEPGPSLWGSEGQGGATMESEADGSARLVLFDRGGSGAAWLGVLPDGSRSLLLSDAKHTATAMFGVTAEGSLHLMLADRVHRQRANLTLLPEGPTHLDLAGKDGKGGATLGVTVNGAPGLRLFDRDGKAGAVLVAAEGSAGLTLRDPEGRDVAGLATDAGRWPRLFFSVDGKKTGALLGMSEDGSPGLALFDEFGRPRTVLGRASTAGALQRDGRFSLLFLNPAGKILHRTPK